MRVGGKDALRLAHVGVGEDQRIRHPECAAVLGAELLRGDRYRFVDRVDGDLEPSNEPRARSSAESISPPSPAGTRLTSTPPCSLSGTGPLPSVFSARSVPGCMPRLCYDSGMARTRISTTVDAELLASARQARAGVTDAALIDEALAALLARRRAAEFDAAYAAYDAQPLHVPDEWGDLASFREAAGTS
jgi:hypothetical protein